MTDICLEKTIKEKYKPSQKEAVVDFISGPSSLSIQYNNNNKVFVYIFGEVHGYKYCCEEIILDDLLSKFNNIDMVAEAMANFKIVGIQYYLKTLFDTTDKFIDFYLETPIFKKQLDDNITNGYMNLVRELTINCFPSKTGKIKDCRWKNIRAHYTDIRQLKGSTLTSLVDFFFSNDLNDLNSEYFWDTYGDILEQIANVSNENEMTKLIFDDLIKNKTLRKEISKSSLSNQILEKYLNIAINAYIQDIKDDVINDLKIITQNKEILLDRDNLYHLVIQIQYMTAAMLDIYTFARIFRNFKESPPQKNIIIYTGNHHATILRTLFNKEGFITSHESILGSEDEENDEEEDKNPKRCLNVRNISQPFFEI